MQSFGLDALRDNLAQLRRISQVNESIRKHFSEDGDLTHSALSIGANNYLAAQNNIPLQIEWRIYDHSAFITRLYALYELFVLGLVGEWLKFLPKFFPTWSELPKDVGKNYRVAIGNLLQKFGGARTDHMSELSIIEGFYSGVSGLSKYSLVPEAFFLSLLNLRESEISGLFKKIGLSEKSGLIDIETWLSEQGSALGVFCVSNSISVTSQLKTFIDYRNDCAHGPIDIDNVLGTNELFILNDFIYLLCESLVQFVLWSLAKTVEANGECEIVGKVIKYYPKHRAAIVLMNESHLKINDIVVVRTKAQCFYSQIISLQLDDIDVDEIKDVQGQEIGICLTEVPKEGAEIIRFTLPS
jgi:MAE_28990/MAE_18760-like HEPN